jgi:hypothetical protein
LGDDHDGFLFVTNRCQLVDERIEMLEGVALTFTRKHFAGQPWIEDLVRGAVLRKFLKIVADGNAALRAPGPMPPQHVGHGEGLPAENQIRGPKLRRQDTEQIAWADEPIEHVDQRRPDHRAAEDFHVPRIQHDDEHTRARILGLFFPFTLRVWIDARVFDLGNDVHKLERVDLLWLPVFVDLEILLFQALDGTSIPIRGIDIDADESRAASEERALLRFLEFGRRRRRLLLLRLLRGKYGAQQDRT